MQKLLKRLLSWHELARYIEYHQYVPAMAETDEAKTAFAQTFTSETSQTSW